MSERTNKLINENDIDLLWENMRELHSLYSNEEQSFFAQIQHITDIRWNGNKVQEILFQASYPCISKMSKNQFVFYMYYRTQMLNGYFFIPTSVSYIYAFMYEILTGIDNIEISRTIEMLDYLVENTRKFIEEDHGIITKICYWKPKILLLHKYKSQGKMPVKSNMIQYQKNDLILWENIAKYCIEKSEFITKYNLLDHVKNALSDVIRELEARYEHQEINIIQFLVGDLEKTIDFEKFFPNSIWTNFKMEDFLPIECGEIQYNPIHTEYVNVIDEFGNTIKQERVRLHEIWNNLALYILKSIEIQFMSFVGYKNRMRKPVVKKDKNGIKVRSYNGNIRCFSSDMKKRSLQYTFLSEIPNIVDVTDTTIKSYILNHKKIFMEVSRSIPDMERNISQNKAANVVILENEKIKEEIVNSYTLQAARNTLQKNQTRLVIEENDETTVKTNVSLKSNTKTFSSMDISLLKVLLEHKDLGEFNKTILKSYYTINMLIEEINTKAEELIGDIVIDQCTGTISIIDDYIEVCREWVKNNE